MINTEFSEGKSNIGNKQVGLEAAKEETMKDRKEKEAPEYFELSTIPWTELHSHKKIITKVIRIVSKPGRSSRHF